MGFLRKVGKKIKKGVKKLLGGKFGKLIGGIGLAMMFWGGANALFGNTKWFQGLKTNLGKMNPFGKADVTGAVDTATKVMDTSTAAVGEAGTAEALTGEALAGAAESVKTGLQLGQEATRTLTDIPFSELDLGQKIAKVGVETKEFLVPEVGSVKEFAGDVTRQVGFQYAMGALEGEPVDEGGYGRMPQVGSMEAPQAAYVTEVQRQMPQMQGMDFQGLNTSLFYGTLSPQWLAEQAREMQLAYRPPGI